MLTVSTVAILNQQSADEIIVNGGSDGEDDPNGDVTETPEVIPAVDTTVMQPVLSTVTIGQTGGPPAEPITPVDPTLQWARADVAPGEALGQLAYGTSVIGDGPFMRCLPHPDDQISTGLRLLPSIAPTMRCAG